MYKEIQKMMDAYHTFASYPVYADIKTLMPAIEHGHLLMPVGRDVTPLTDREIVNIFNDQWLSMSNTSRQCISVNIKPRVAHGKYMGLNKTKDVYPPEDNIVIDGDGVLLANYSAYIGGKATKNIYFSVADNEFMQTSYSEKGVVPVNTLFNHNSKLDLKSNTPADNNLQARLHDADLNRILDEVNEKWQSFVFPMNLCRGLTSWQQDGWRSALKGDK